MKILLINHYAGSPKHGMEYRPYYFAKEWIRAGHQVKIIASSYSHVRNVQLKMAKNEVGEKIDGISYLWLKTPGYQGNGVKRVFNLLAFMMRLKQYREKIAADFHPDCVVASSTHPLDIYSAHWIAKKCNSKLIYEVHDLWPLSPIELGGIPKWHPFMLFLQHAEDYAYRHSDAVVSMLPKAKEHMIKRGMDAHKFNYIPNGIDVTSWQNGQASIPKKHQDLIDALRAKHAFIMCYAGAHGAANDLSHLIDAAALLHNTKVRVVLIGNGPLKASLEKKVINAGISNVYFLPPVNKNEIPKLLTDFDTLFISLQNQSLFRFGISPNKLMDYMMAGKPVISAIKAGNDPVTESGCGYSIEPGNSQAIADALSQMIHLSDDERKEMGARGKEYVLEHHDIQKLASKFLEVIEK